MAYIEHEGSNRQIRPRQRESVIRYRRKSAIIALASHAVLRFPDIPTLLRSFPDHPWVRALGAAPKMLRASELRQRFRSSTHQQAMDRQPFGAHVCQLEVFGARFGDRNQVGPAGKQVRPGPEALATDALDAVAPHGGADLSAYDETQPRRPRGVRVGRLSRDEENEVSRRHAPSEALSSYELPMGSQPAGPAEGEGHRRRQARGRRSRAYFL